MSSVDFIPVILGSDINAYGMARAFHMEYGIRSVAVSKTILMATSDTKLIDFEFEPNLEDADAFLNKLLQVKAKYSDKKLLLVPCSDGYVKLMIKWQDKLRDKFYFNCISEQLLDELTLKDNFYEVCERYGFDYPKTVVVEKDNWRDKSLGFEFPVILKASNSVEYYNCSFEGKRKVFIAQDRPEYERILSAIYSSSYKDSMTIQEYIPGDDSNMRVLNCYVGKDKKVKLMALGHALLEEHTPQGIGNYTAIISTYDKALLDRFKVFLEEIGYQGFANFDMKYDTRDNTYKLFETNVRQGRSSFFVVASGYNFARWLVDDVIYDKPLDTTYADNQYLWKVIPDSVLYKYCQNKEMVALAKKLIKEGKVCNSLFYKKDLTFKRFLRVGLFHLNHHRKFKKYYGKKGMS